MLTEFAALSAEVHITFAVLLGLLVGSFLNVVVFRYPKILHYQWTLQSQQWLDIDSASDTPPPGLIRPSSHCGHCKSPVKAWQNIPIISFLLLKGRCANCQSKIALRYPLVELLTGALSGYVVYTFGWSIQSLAGLLLTWVLVSLTFIDFDHQLLPDDIVLPTLWLGVFLSLFTVFATPIDSIIGVIVGYLSLWLVFQLFKIMTGKEGMGHGDFKLLALLGAWLGWQMLPQIVMISTLVGSVVGLSLIAFKKANKSNAIPFGPYIALAGWIALIWGKQINQLYLSSVGL